jgi:hypothetical protein
MKNFVLTFLDLGNIAPRSALFYYKVIDFTKKTVQILVQYYLGQEMLKQNFSFAI